MDINDTAENTDKQIWVKDPDNGWSPTIHATKEGCIGINVGGRVIVMAVEKWHVLGELRCALDKLLREQ